MDRSSAISLTFAVMILSGCGSSVPANNPQHKEIYTYRTAQSAPEPVYFRFKKARSPEPLPTEEPFIGDEEVDDVLSVRGGKTSLGKLIKIVAEDIGYDFFVSSLVIDNVRIMPTSSGKVDVVLGKIASVYDVKVILDHNSRKLSVLRNES